jgi:hypothetical protein
MYCIWAPGMDRGGIREGGARALRLLEAGEARYESGNAIKKPRSTPSEIADRLEG